MTEDAKRRQRESEHHRLVDPCRDVAAERRVMCRAFHLWNGLRRGAMLPRLTDVDLARIGLPDLEPHLYLIAARKPYRRSELLGHGTILDGLTGTGAGVGCADRRGLPLTEALPGELAEATAQFAKSAVEYRHAMPYAGHFFGPDGRMVLYRNILLPLTEEGASRVTHLLGALNFRISDDET